MLLRSVPKISGRLHLPVGTKGSFCLPVNNWLCSEASGIRGSMCRVFTDFNEARLVRGPRRGGGGLCGFVVSQPGFCGHVQAEKERKPTYTQNKKKHGSSRGSSVSVPFLRDKEDENRSIAPERGV